MGVFAPSDVVCLAAAVLESVGADPERASIVGETLVDADRRGLHSHGVLRLPVYTAAIRAGGIVPLASMQWVEEMASTAVLDAAFGFGQIAMMEATARTADLAEHFGSAVVGVRNSTHFGAGSYWAERLTQRGLVGLIMSNTGPCVAPFGSREALLGTNPFTIGVPSLGEPMLLDMATSEAAYGKIIAAAGEGDSIPMTWAVDSQGRPTSDPAAALDGALLPFGGHKGSGLSIAVELLASSVVGARASHEMTDIWIDPSSQMGTGHLIIAFRPLVPAAEAQRRAQDVLDRIRSSATADGHERVLAPGDLEAERSQKAQLHGIQLPDGVVAALRELAESLNIDVDLRI